MNIWTHIDDMTWPMPCEDMNDLSYRLTYADNISKQDRLAAASVMAAYRQMIRDPRDQRQRVVRGIRAAMSAEGEVMRHVTVNPLRGGGYTISSHAPGCGLTFWDGDCWHGDAPGSTERVWARRAEADAEIPRAEAALAALRLAEWTMPDELTKGVE
jgi:hypothetical protein